MTKAWQATADEARAIAARMLTTTGRLQPWERDRATMGAMLALGYSRRSVRRCDSRSRHQHTLRIAASSR